MFTTINSITGAIANEKIASLNAKTDQERIAADERVASLTAQRDVLIQDSRVSKLDIWTRTAIAFPVAFIVNKLFIYDKALGWGTTEINTNDNLWYVIMAVIGFYFMHSAVGLFRK